MRKLMGKKQKKNKRNPVTCYLSTTHPEADQPTRAGEGWERDPFGNRLAVL